MLISKEDLTRIDLLKAERQGDLDIEWVCDLAIKLARLKPTEAEFPTSLALINSIVCNAFPMYFMEAVLVEQSLDVNVPFFSHTTQCGVKEALLVLSLYIKPLTNDVEIFDFLSRTGKVTVSVDGKPVSTGPLAEVLVGPDGYGVRRKPFRLNVPKFVDSGVFQVGSYDPFKQMATPMDQAGIFLGNNCTIKVHWEGIPDVDVPFLVGLVMARYKTYSESVLGVLHH